ncbi:hypothetical protein [Agrococcus sp. Marseille-Q4369]|uniref:hypothetical protein n=1 Tax=Agrococcus sp. Marseille-Q4369 TaxID=2810513 RepID=UPI001B8AE01F|nr:hypothetical protein [Agrococcus sp. Marseille-Q4369]QUW18907.1 hypothetical protein JSQ78_00535 [Agrococcus sp. Marseille-Q4369]
MAHSQSRRRDAKKHRARVADAPPESWYEMDPDEVFEEHEMPIAMPCNCCRIVQRNRYVQHSLAFFAIVWTRRDGFGRWIEQYSVDTGHGYFHEHVHGHQRPNDRRNIRPLRAQVDVQECFDEGYDQVHARQQRGCKG